MKLENKNFKELRKDGCQKLNGSLLAFCKKQAQPKLFICRQQDIWLSHNNLWGKPSFLGLSTWYNFLSKTFLPYTQSAY
jgi:hypothetical protein